MCGRFALGIPRKRLEELFARPVPDGYGVRYNLAPGADVLAVTQAGLAWRRWGLVPPWAESPKVGSGMINARSETVFDKPSFHGPVRENRLLVPAQAFYEWRREGKRKEPFAISLTDADCFAMAAIGAAWTDPACGEVLDSLAILTCAPNAVMAPIHDRMPVILSPGDWAEWLDPAPAAPGRLSRLLVPYPAHGMRAWPVSDRVNSVAHDSPDLLREAGKIAPRQGSLL